MTLKTSPLRPIRAGARNYAWTKSIRHTYPTSFFDIPAFVIDQALCLDFIGYNQNHSFEANVTIRKI